MSKCLDCRCKDFEKCFLILNLMLDNEATEEQKSYFKMHIADCKVCFAHFNIEKELRQLIKTKINKKSIPCELADEIRLRIMNRTI